MRLHNTVLHILYLQGNMHETAQFDYNTANMLPCTPNRVCLDSQKDTVLLV